MLHAPSHRVISPFNLNNYHQIHKMSSIEGLSDELLLLVFERLIAEGRPRLDLKTLRLVCRRFRPIASSLLFRNVAIHFPTDASGNLTSSENLQRPENVLGYLIDHEQIRAQVQTISIYGHFHGYGIEDVSGHLARLLPSFPRLKNIWYVDP